MVFFNYIGCKGMVVKQPKTPVKWFHFLMVGGNHTRSGVQPVLMAKKTIFALPKNGATRVTGQKDHICNLY